MSIRQREARVAPTRAGSASPLPACGACNESGKALRCHFLIAILSDCASVASQGRLARRFRRARWYEQSVRNRRRQVECMDFVQTRARVITDETGAIAEIPVSAHRSRAAGTARRLPALAAAGPQRPVDAKGRPGGKSAAGLYEGQCRLL